MKKIHPSPATSGDRRKARLAAALRDNLARRKVRSRATDSVGDSETGLVEKVADPEGSVTPDIEASSS